MPEQHDPRTAGQSEAWEASSNGHAEDAGEPAPAGAERPLPVPTRITARPVQASGVGGLQRERAPGMPAAQAMAVAAGGFVAGAAVAGIVHRRRSRRRPARQAGRQASRKGARAAELVQIVASRSLLVDVHLLGFPGADR
jgi:hypothetical protein